MVAIGRVGGVLALGGDSRPGQGCDDVIHQANS